MTTHSTILVVYASEKGSTAAIAEHIADSLRTSGDQVSVAPASDAPPPEASRR